MSSQNPVLREKGTDRPVDFQSLLVGEAAVPAAGDRQQLVRHMVFVELLV